MANTASVPWRPLAVAAVIGVAVGIISVMHTTATPPAASAAGPGPAAGAFNAAAQANKATPGQPPAPVTPESTGEVGAWLAGLNSADAAIRMASIRALATAPRESAVPALVQIAGRGPNRQERYAALDALRTQALQHGDADDAIHGVVRTLVYDGNDEQVTAYAADLLEALDR